MITYDVYEIEAIGLPKAQEFLLRVNAYDDNLQNVTITLNIESYEFLKWFDKDTMARIKQNLIDTL